MKPILFAALFFFLTGSAELYAKETRPHLLKNNSFALAGGLRIQDSAKFLDYWIIDKQDFNSFITEFIYERKLLKFLNLNISLGQFGLSANFNSTDDRININSVYSSTGLKIELPVFESFVFYAEGGGTYYYTSTRYRIIDSAGIIYTTDSALGDTFGLYGIGGLEYYFYKHPENDGFYDMPLALFVAYKISSGTIKEIDQKAIDLRNSLNNSNDAAHDLDLGGKIALMGLKWRF